MPIFVCNGICGLANADQDCGVGSAAGQQEHASAPERCRASTASVECRNLFLYPRFIEKNGKQPSVSSELHRADWANFLKKSDPFSAGSWMSQFSQMEKKFMNYSTEGLKMQIHIFCKRRDWDCAVLPAYKYQLCLYYISPSPAWMQARVYPWREFDPRC
ncbi:hypothetical protein BBJ28_00023825 [Nothophytophthora sp. Chile5]|nr:hypothetical protein BBJ28_00023825 [Nothophytophthora sp. Chile5]